MTTKKTSQLALECWAALREEQPCVHHWVIETPAGETSTGFCRKCDAKRDGFRNYLGEYGFKESKYILTEPVEQRRSWRDYTTEGGW